MDSPTRRAAAPPTLDATLTAHLETEQAERSRWAGTMLMYAPLLPLMVMICGMVEAAAAGWAPGPSGAQPPWYAMLPFAAGALGLLPAIPVALFGAVKRMLASARLNRLCAHHRVESLPPWPAVAPGERIGPLVTDVVAPGRLVLVYMPAPPAVWRIMGFCAGGILTGVLILVGVMVSQSLLGGRDLFNLVVPAIMLVGVLSIFGSRRLSFESSPDGPVFISRYRFPGVPYWFTRRRALTEPVTQQSRAAGPHRRWRRAGSLIAQSGVRWGLDTGVFGEWKLSRLEETVVQALSATTSN